MNNKLRKFEALGMKSILVGCSGGADSMALLNMCHEYGKLSGIRVRAVHINHGVQAKNDDWQYFVEDECNKLDIDLIVGKLDIYGKSNMEEVARKGRQNMVSKNIQVGEWMLTAHHANDQAENIIMALARSGGYSALSGMDEISQIGDYISAKPMLGMSKIDVYKYCDTKSIEYVEDPTNFESVQDRNFVRNEVIPLIETRWPQFVKSVNGSAGHIRKIGEMVEDEVDATDDSIGFTGVEGGKDESLLRIWLKKRFGKSAGNNVVNQVMDYSKSENGHELDIKGFKLGIWKNTVFDLRGEVKYKVLSDEVRYKGELKSVVIGGITKPLKKVFKEFGVAPWDRGTVPFYFEEGELIGLGNVRVGDKDGHYKN